MKLIYKTIQKVDSERTGITARAERNKAGLTLSTVAGGMGVSSMFLSHLERGLKTWNAGHVEKFNEAIKREGA